MSTGSILNLVATADINKYIPVKCSTDTLLIDMKSNTPSNINRADTFTIGGILVPIHVSIKFIKSLKIIAGECIIINLPIDTWLAILEHNKNQETNNVRIVKNHILLPFPQNMIESNLSDKFVIKNRQEILYCFYQPMHILLESKYDFYFKLSINNNFYDQKYRSELFSKATNHPVMSICEFKCDENSMKKTINLNSMAVSNIYVRSTSKITRIRLTCSAIIVFDYDEFMIELYSKLIEHIPWDDRYIEINLCHPMKKIEIVKKWIHDDIVHIMDKYINKTYDKKYSYSFPLGVCINTLDSGNYWNFNKIDNSFLYIETAGGSDETSVYAIGRNILTYTNGYAVLKYST
jgi:5S rRNA maturation endonuclease (ribonuclease M5)